MGSQLHCCLNERDKGNVALINQKLGDIKSFFICLCNSSWTGETLTFTDYE